MALMGAAAASIPSETGCVVKPGDQLMQSLSSGRKHNTGGQGTVIESLLQRTTGLGDRY